MGILHNEELHDLQSSPHSIRDIKQPGMMWSEHIIYMGDRKCGYMIFMGKPEGTMSLGRPRRRWKDNIKIDFKGTGRLQRSRIRC
jgi:hypothetical protein